LLFRVQDILDALEAIRSYIAGMEYQDFVADRRTVDAVIRFTVEPDGSTVGGLFGLKVMPAK
jgi:uncharacterized protein with HEPN domain